MANLCTCTKFLRATSVTEAYISLLRKIFLIRRVLWRLRCMLPEVSANFVVPMSLFNSHNFLIIFSGHFLLVHLLLPKLKAAPSARIVNTTALSFKLGEMDFDDLMFEKREFTPGIAYAQSKLAVVLYTKQLAKELEGMDLLCILSVAGYFAP